MQVPPPKLSQDFELLCFDLFRMLWDDPHAQLNGRGGQAQRGVDVFGKPQDGSSYCGVQCKVKDRGLGAKLTFKEIAAEVAEADQFIPKLGHFIVATTASRDAAIQEEVRLLSEARVTEGKFSVSVVAWEDFLHFLDQHADVAAKYYPFSRSATQAVANDPLPGEQSKAGLGFQSDLVTQQLSARLADVVGRLNERSGEPRLSLSRIAQEMGFDKLSTLARFLDGTDEPTIQFLQSFSTRFGVNFSWLLHGDDQPFYHEEPVVFGPMEAVALIDATAPEEIIFVRSQSAQGECTLILKYNEWRYHTLSHAWHVSAEVGGTGTGHLVELYDLILLLRDRKSCHCRGQVLVPRDFERLVQGEVFPGAALAVPHRDGDWWYALPDFEHEFPSAPHYRDWYGQSFLDAQSILRRKLRPDLESQ